MQTADSQPALTSGDDLDEWVRQVVATAPPLSSAQCAQLATLAEECRADLRAAQAVTEQAA